MSISKKISFSSIQNFVCVLSLFLASVSSNAQQVIFNRVFTPEGAYFGMINGMTQDQQGYIWFTSFGFGLYRYDGYHVTLFRHNPTDSNSLATNFTHGVFVDHKGFTW